MIEKDLLESEIQKLIDSTKQSASSLSEPENKAKLQDIIKSDDKGFPLIVRFIHKFHPEVISSCITENWDALEQDSRSKFVNEIIKMSKRDNDLKIRLHMVARLADTDPKEAFRLFSHTCEQFTEKNSKDPSSKLIKSVRPLLLTDPPQMVKLPLDSDCKRDLGPIMTTGLLAAFASDKTDKEIISPEVQHQILKWLFSAGKSILLTESNLKDIAACIDKWPLSQLPRLKELISKLPEALRNIIINKYPYLFQPEMSVRDQTGSPQGRSFDPLTALQKIIEYITNKEKESEVSNREKGEKIRKLEDELSTEKKSIEAITLKHNQLEQEKEKNTALINQEKENNAELRGQISRLNEEVNVAKELAQRQAIDIEKMSSDHKAEIVKHGERISSESEHAVGVLKTKLKSSLSIEHSDFNSILEKPMSADLGDSLRSQVKRIFKKLSDEGIAFSGGQ